MKGSYTTDAPSSLNSTGTRSKSTTIVMDQQCTHSPTIMGLLTLVQIQVELGLASIITRNHTLDLSTFRSITSSVMAVLLAGITTMELVIRLNETKQFRNGRNLRKLMK